MRQYRERGPHIEMQGTMPDGTVEEGQFMVVEGGTPQRVAGFAAANVDPKDRTEANKRGYEQIRPGGWDPVERLKDQDIDGIVSEVIYPSMAMPYFSLPDTGLQQAVFRAYNDWIAEFCSHAPQRLVGLAMVCTDEVEKACAELRRARDLGLRGALIPNSLAPEASYSDPAFDPLWATAAELDMPLSMHILTGRYRMAGAAADPVLVWYMDLPAPGDEVDDRDAVFRRLQPASQPQGHLGPRTTSAGSVTSSTVSSTAGTSSATCSNLDQDLSPNEYFRAQHLGHLPERSGRRTDSRSDRRQPPDVGLRLSPRRQHLAGVAPDDQLQLPGGRTGRYCGDLLRHGRGAVRDRVVVLTLSPRSAGGDVAERQRGGPAKPTGGAEGI